MYNASANDLERVASDLDRIAQKYQAGSEELDQYVITLEGATSYLLSGAIQQWRGISSEAFLSAWLERKARLQQASMLMSESIGYLQRLSSTIEDNLPAIRADQNIMMSQTIFSTLGADAQASIMNEELQAQNAVFMAIAALNSQLEQLIEEVNDCPEADEEGPFPGFGDNINRSDSNAGGSGDAGGNNEGGSESATPPLNNGDEAQIDPAKFERYSMDPDNPNNRNKEDDPATGKWVAFVDLGYDVYTPEGRAAGAQDLMNQVRNELPDEPATFEKMTSHGPRYRVEIPVTGPNGKTGTLVTVWQYDDGSTEPRMITNWLKSHH